MRTLRDYVAEGFNLLRYSGHFEELSANGCLVEAGPVDPKRHTKA